MSERAAQYKELVVFGDCVGNCAIFFGTLVYSILLQNIFSLLLHKIQLLGSFYSHAASLTTLYCFLPTFFLSLPPVLLSSLVSLLFCCPFPPLFLSLSVSFAPRSIACVCTVCFRSRPGRGWVDSNGRLTASCYPPDTGQCRNEKY